MQQFNSIPSTDTLTNSRAELLNNDSTIMSNSSGTSFPTTNIQQGMFCLRTDLNQLFQLKDLNPTWVMVFDLAQVATNKAYVDTAISGCVPASEVVTTATANALLLLNSSGQLPASITGSAASVPWSGISGTPSSFNPPIATDSMVGGIKQGSGISIAGDGTASVNISSAPHGKQLFTGNGTFTVPSGISTVWVSMSGGGGGGGGGNVSGGYAGGGGGGAAAILAAAYGVSGNQVINITVAGGGNGGVANTAGASGGISSFGAIVSCAGGGGGANGGSSSGNNGGNSGGSGGSAGQGTISLGVGGAGGSSIFGGGGVNQQKSGSGGGQQSGSGYGAGGSGGANASVASGGNGSQGFCLVEW